MSSVISQSFCLGQWVNTLITGYAYGMLDCYHLKKWLVIYSMKNMILSKYNIWINIFIQGEYSEMLTKLWAFCQEELINHSTCIVVWHTGSWHETNNYGEYYCP